MFLVVTAFAFLRFLLLRYHVRLLGGARRVLGLAHASALHQHVILASQRHRAERNDQEQVGHIGLRTLAADHIALRGSEIDHSSEL